MFSNTFAGIAPSSVPGYVVAEVVGGVVAIVIIKVLYPTVTPARPPRSCSLTTETGEPTRSGRQRRWQALGN